MFKRLAIVPLIAIATALGACSQQAQNETAQAADTIAADANATAAKARDSTDAALGAAEARMDNVGDVIGNKIDKAGDAAGAALKDAGNEIED